MRMERYTIYISFPFCASSPCASMSELSSKCGMYTDAPMILPSVFQPLSVSGHMRQLVSISPFRESGGVRIAGCSVFLRPVGEYGCCCKYDTS